MLAYILPNQYSNRYDKLNKIVTKYQTGKRCCEDCTGAK